MLKEIVSGGQTGADMAGLDAAKHVGLKTGGLAPKGWKTENGCNPKLKEYGLFESASSAYNDRTIANVMGSCGTAWFGLTDSPGARVTLNAAKRCGRPLIVNPRSVEEFQQWLRDNSIQTLNVAGNRESKRPGIYQRVFDFLVKALG